MLRLLPVLLLAVSEMAAGAQTPASGAADGRVTDALTGNGLSGAILHLFPRGPIKRGSAVEPPTTASREDGSFHFESVSSGTYTLFATHSGYVWAGGTSQTITVADGQQVLNISVQLNPLGSLSGKVVDADGSAVAGASIELFSAYSMRGRLQLRRVRGTSAKPDGSYLVKSVNPGKYILAAEPADEEGRAEEKNSNGSASAKHVETSAGESVLTFYPHTQDSDSATAVEMQPGQNMTDVDVQLQRGQTFHVRGRVEAVTPDTLTSGGTLNLAPRGSFPTDGLGRRSTVAQDGRFDIERVIAGSYTLWLTGSYGGGQGGGRRSRHRLLARQDVEVNAGNVNGLALALLPPINLTGQVTLGNQSAAQNNLAQVRVSLTPSAQTGLGGFQTVPVKSDGSFAIQDLEPGNYSVRVFNAPVGMYVQSVSLNRQDVTVSGLDLSQGGAGEIEITLRSGAAEVDGTLNAGVGTNQAATGTALLVPEKLPADGSGVLSATVNSTGGFAIRNVPPGRYFAYAVDRWSSIWQNPDFLLDVQRRGQTVQVPENGHLQVQLTLLTTDQIQLEASGLGLTATNP